MPTHKVKGGYQWGKHGKVYPTKKQADKQGQAIYASGWRENKEYKSNKNMKKQVIRLTEGDLHRIIKESVNNVLSELDWRTYASAADKAWEKSRNASTPEEKELRQNQSSLFYNHTNRKLEKQYDGINLANYDVDSRNIRPSYKREWADDEGKKHVNFMKNNFGHDETVVPVNTNKQLRGASHVSRFKKGLSTYQDGKWSK